MDKRVKINHIGTASCSVTEYTPVTGAGSGILFMLLQSRFEKFEKWAETSRISRFEFEKRLKENSLLEDAYLDHFSRNADFYRCTIVHHMATYEYFIMVKEKKIVLLYHHIVDQNEVSRKII